MWRPDRTVSGPERVTRRDIDALNRIFSDAFTERYRRDGMSGVRVPFLNPAIWEFAIELAGEGAMLWRDARHEIVAFNLAHLSGTEGWMGPLAVRTDRQGHGLGRQVVTAAITLLKARGAVTVGLETMPRTIENIGFYSRLGFSPGALTVTLGKDTGLGAGTGERLGLLTGDARDRAIAACGELVAAIRPGSDYRREVMLTTERQLGDVTLLRNPAGGVAAWALWHSAPLANGRLREELRVLKLAAVDAAAAEAVIAAVEHDARQLGLSRVALRCQTEYGELYRGLIASGFRVQWTDLRMHFGAPPPATGEAILLTNWEI